MNDALWKDRVVATIHCKQTYHAKYMSLEKIKKPSETIFIGKTIEMMRDQFKHDPSLTKSLNSILDSVMHTAPEIVQNRNNITINCLKLQTICSNCKK